MIPWCWGERVEGKRTNSHIAEWAGNAWACSGNCGMLQEMAHLENLYREKKTEEKQKSKRNVVAKFGAFSQGGNTLLRKSGIQITVAVQ